MELERRECQVYCANYCCHRRPSTCSWSYLSRAVLQRQVLLNRRMKGYYIARIIQTSEGQG